MSTVFLRTFNKLLVRNESSIFYLEAVLNTLALQHPATVLGDLAMKKVRHRKVTPHKKQNSLAASVPNLAMTEALLETTSSAPQKNCMVNSCTPPNLSLIEKKMNRGMHTLCQEMKQK